MLNNEMVVIDDIESKLAVCAVAQAIAETDQSLCDAGLTSGLLKRDEAKNVIASLSRQGYKVIRCDKCAG